MADSPISRPRRSSDGDECDGQASRKRRCLSSSRSPKVGPLHSISLELPQISSNNSKASDITNVQAIPSSYADQGSVSSPRTATTSTPESQFPNLSSREFDEMPATLGDEDDCIAQETLSIRSDSSGSTSDRVTCSADPIYAFPFINDDTPFEALQRVFTYFEMEPSLCDAVTESLHSWLDSYLKYARNGSSRQVKRSYIDNLTFWKNLPQLIHSVVDRLISNQSTACQTPIREHIIDQFIDLTVQIMQFDQFDLTNGRVDPCDILDLSCFQYLRIMHHVLARETQPYQPIIIYDIIMDEHPTRRSAKLLSTVSFQMLQQLIKAVPLASAPDTKKMNALIPICTIMLYLIQDIRNAKDVIPSDAMRAHREMAQAVFHDASACLETITPTNGSSVQPEKTKVILSILARVLHFGLFVDDKFNNGPIAAKNDQAMQYRVPSPAATEAWAWQLSILAKYIKSSSMQLQVIGITFLSMDLNAIWRHFEESKDKGIVAALGQMLVQTEILEYLLGSNSHPEIVAESIGVFGFLAAANFLSAEHFNILFEIATSPGNDHKAEAIARVLIHIIRFIRSEHLVSLCVSLLDLPLEIFASRLRQLWDTLGQEVIWRAKTGAGRVPLECIKLWFRIVRDSSNMLDEEYFRYTEIQVAGRQRLRQLLDQCENFDFREIFLQECLAAIRRKDHSATGIMWCLNVLIRPQELQRINKTHRIAELAMDELEHAMDYAAASSYQHVLHGRANEARCTLLHNVFTTCGNDFDDQFSSRTWQLLVKVMAISQKDQSRVWEILTSVDAESPNLNTFVDTCVRVHAKELHGSQLCEEMFELVRVKALATFTVALKDGEAPDALSSDGIVQIWRFIKESRHEGASERAIATMVNDIYLRQDIFDLYPSPRRHLIHSALIQCSLDEMTDISTRLRANISTSPSVYDTVVPELNLQDLQERCSRILRFLSKFVTQYQTKNDANVPDLRPFMSSRPSESRGELTGLLYQSFDGSHETSVKPLIIGSQNTTRCLLAQLKEATGFDNYRIFYKGKPFIPTENEICKPLEELQIRDGLLLVKRDEIELPYPAFAREGCSLVEQVLLTRFSDLWQNWPLGGKIAYETYNLLKLLPADGYVVKMVATDDGRRELSFDASQPTKCLYIAHAIMQYIQFQSREKTKLTDTDSSSAFHNKQTITLFATLILELLSNVQNFDATCQQHLSEVLDCLLLALHDLLDISDETIRGMVSRAINVDQLISVIGKCISMPNHATQAIIDNTFRIMAQLSTMNEQIWNSVTSSAFTNILLDIIALGGEPKLRMSTLTSLEHMVTHEVSRITTMSIIERSSQVLEFLLHLSLKGLRSAVDGAPCSAEFMRLACLVVKSLMESCPSQIDAKDLLRQILTWINHYEPKEKIENRVYSDTIMEGMLSLMHSCALSHKSLVEGCITAETIKDVLWPLLVPTHNAGVTYRETSVVFSATSRQYIYDVLHAFSGRSDGNCELVADLLSKPLQADVLMRDDTVLFDQSFNVDQCGAIKSECGYIGLYNLSNTCYLNSLMTQLFMNLDFRRILFEQSIVTKDAGYTVLLNLQKIFALMQGSVAKLIKPYELVKSIKTFENVSIDETNQMDVDEFYNLLFDRLEADMSSDAGKKTLREFYGGQLVQQIKSQECQHISEKIEDFSAIQCEVRGNLTLQESLLSYITGEIMDGDNKYRCALCDRHVKAVKRACLKQVPDNLIFHLKRFDFNLRTMHRSKINDHFSFPEEIDMAPFTLEHLRGDTPQSTPDVFVLVGMLIHTGTAESGHYYSLVKERKQVANWIEFNDELVSPWSSDNMADIAFGGVESNGPNDPPTEKMNSAYMLFYQRLSSFRSQIETARQHEAGSGDYPLIPLRFRSYVDAINSSIMHTFCLFDDGYGDVVQRVLQTAVGQSYNKSSGHSLHRTALVTALNYLCRFSCRKRDKSCAIRLLEQLTGAASGCLRCAGLFLNCFSEDKSAFRILLQRNPDPAIRSKAATAFLMALDTIKREAPASYDACRDEQPILLEEMGSTTACQVAINIFDYMWQYLNNSLRSWDICFTLLLKFAQRGRAEALQLLNEGYLVQTVRFLTSDSSFDEESSISRILTALQRRRGAQSLSFSSVIQFIHTLLGYLADTLGPESIVDDISERKDVGNTGLLPWTAEEVTATHVCHPDDSESSIFVERLLFLGQGEEETMAVLVRLVQTGSTMEKRVFSTLLRAISDNTELSLGSFIEASAAYVSCTTSLEHAEQLTDAILDQPQTFSRSEEEAALTFLRVVFQLDDRFGGRLRLRALELAPTWAPQLLVCEDASLRIEASSLLEIALLGGRASEKPSAKFWETLGMAKPAVHDLIRKLSSSCLLFMVRQYIQEQSAIQRDAGLNLFSMVDLCRERMFTMGILTDEEMMEMELETRKIMKAAEGVMVHKITETDSEWEDEMDIDGGGHLMASG